jgi:glyoxylase I family protein
MFSRCGNVQQPRAGTGMPGREGGALLSPAAALLSSPMAQLALHHINVIVTDLPRSLAFYQKLLGLTIMERPPFRTVGAWLASGTLQLHLTVHPLGSFRTSNIDNDDCHFAFRTDDFDDALATLTAGGFREDATEDDPMRVFVRRNSPAGFPQLFVLDPDRNIVEISGAA